MKTSLPFLIVLACGTLAVMGVGFAYGHLHAVSQTPDLLKLLWRSSKLPFPKSVFT